VKLLITKALAIKQISKQLVVILIDFSIVPALNDKNQSITLKKIQHKP
jgi:hypothetical protein